MSENSADSTFSSGGFCFWGIKIKRQTKQVT